jgi:hypothetical protein
MADCKHKQLRQEVFSPTPNGQTFFVIRCADRECDQLLAVVPKLESDNILRSFIKHYENMIHGFTDLKTKFDSLISQIKNANIPRA